MDLIIRSAAPKDLPSLLEIINHAILNTTAIYDYEPRSLEEQKEWFEKMFNDGMPVIVAEREGKVIGYGSYNIFRPKIGYKFSVEHSIYLDEKSRGLGVGGKLLGSLIQRARESGLHSMIAGIDATNRGSIEFHKKYGFVEKGYLKEVGYKFDQWLDLVFMQLLLEED
ncbi:N-acetyltransferase family protein [Dyadobacter chenwenxiniae]|uniref:N-acetyltransferase family protein n=1 Tax=Dyadobacter chenwenxiniae TaxID=2906456 RepID=A0A9X1PF20_9BACT|nr:GNAT family N-acetyltransferase [Dyadobacter chenwenxiniae]MCF0052779.1 N-acetyltransferase family protein [Dyadobacter chenwenxiniae]MCF0060045.1 N-acetyltransferase family protein [Dyadobacter chenwenxiniae]UON85785.1 N-acetyltransferase family protein [Dyadobacter chenwenxiniae]